jgi:hypothetical protein
MMDQIVKARVESFDQMTLGKACDVSARKRDGLAGDVLGLIRDDEHQNFIWQTACAESARVCLPNVTNCTVTSHRRPYDTGHHKPSTGLACIERIVS